MDAGCSQLERDDRPELRDPLVAHSHAARRQGQVVSFLFHSLDPYALVDTDQLGVIDLRRHQQYSLPEPDFAYIPPTFPLLDRDQPALPGEPKSFITRDLALLELFKLRGLAPPQDVVAFFAAAGAEIGGVTGPVRDLAERVRLAMELGAVAYVPGGRGGSNELAAEEPEETQHGEPQTRRPQAMSTHCFRILGAFVLVLSQLGLGGIASAAQTTILPSDLLAGDVVQALVATQRNVQVNPPLQDIAAVAAGGFRTCALTASGGVKCWGENRWGQLGDGTTSTRSTPVQVSGLVNGVSAVSAGEAHTCALTTTGKVKCCGSYGVGMVGETAFSSLTPVDVSGLDSGVIALAAGGTHTCALTTGGGVKCWGTNNNGQLGDGTTDSSITPVAVSGLASGVVALAAGTSHTCALTAGGGVKCWGANDEGKLGDGTSTDHSAPVDVSGLTHDVAALAAGAGHTCAQMRNGGARCWGGNWAGQLGNGTTTNPWQPVNVKGLTSGVATLTAGY